MSKKKDSKSNPEKNAQLIIRINRVERDRFIDTCAEIDTTAAREIRRFIRNFIKEKSA